MYSEVQIQQRWSDHCFDDLFEMLSEHYISCWIMGFKPDTWKTHLPAVDSSDAMIYIVKNYKLIELGIAKML